MATQQTENAPTNVETSTKQQVPVSFEDVSLQTLKSSFNDTFKISKGSASQVVLGFQSMTERLQEPSNEYQQVLYPRLKQLCSELYAKYTETFLTSFTSDTERQVFGANLNGNHNNGSLYRAIPSGVNKNLSYNYAQFGQLVRVLTSRLRFIVQRDPNNVPRYKNNQEEFAAYEQLRQRVTTFLEYVTTLSADWNTLVTDTRTKFSVSEPQREQRPRPQYQRVPHHGSSQHAPRQSSEQREQHTQRPRQTTRTQRPQRVQETSGEWQKVRGRNN
jgi:hypothetical protein